MATMAKPQNVHTNFKQADVAERISAQLLKDAGWYVCDVSKSSVFRAADIDLLCHRREEAGGVKVISVEVKRDDRGYETGNLIMETVSNTNKDTPGWTLYTKSDLLFVVQGPLLHILPGPETVEWFKANYDRFKEIIVPTVFKDGEKTRYYAKARLIPRHTYDREVGIIDTIDLREMGLYPAQAS